MWWHTFLVILSRGVIDLPFVPTCLDNVALAFEDCLATLEHAIDNCGAIRNPRLAFLLQHEALF